jgi:hypothetical protein
MDTDSNQTEKEQQWQKMADNFAHITDKLGKRIDAGILDTVIVLNLLGIHTRQSCEGHLEWGTGSPWVDLEVPGLDDEEQVARDAFTEAQKQKEQGQLSQEDIKQLFQAARQLRTVVKHKHLEGRRKVMSYLAAFYDQRIILYDVRLIIQAQGMGCSRIESQGADLQDTAPLDVRKQKLQEYQKEMQSFTAFLTEVWFSGREKVD